MSLLRSEINFDDDKPKPVCPNPKCHSTGKLVWQPFARQWYCAVCHNSYGEHVVGAQVTKL
jgi:hypothetical protein